MEPSIGVRLDWYGGGRPKAFERVPIQDQARLIEKAVWLLEEWPGRLVGIARRQSIRGSALLHDMEDVPFWYWKEIKR